MGGRGQKRQGQGGGGGQWSPSVNAYQIPERLEDAIGAQGEARSIATAQWESNPYYSDTYREFSENCQRCVWAYEMQRRGYDVEALPTYKDDMMPSGGNWLKAMDGITEADVSGRNNKAVIANIEKQLKEWGEGSRAIIRVKWQGFASGHVINVEYTNGKFYYVDAQDRYRSTDPKVMLSGSAPSRTMLYRTDNATITDEMRKIVRQRRK